MGNPELKLVSPIRDVSGNVMHYVVVQRDETQNA
jgi:hypothetical protein